MGETPKMLLICRATNDQFADQAHQVVDPVEWDTEHVSDLMDGRGRQVLPLCSRLLWRRLRDRRDRLCLGGGGLTGARGLRSALGRSNVGRCGCLSRRAGQHRRVGVLESLCCRIEVAHVSLRPNELVQGVKGGQ